MDIDELLDESSFLMEEKYTNRGEIPSDKDFDKDEGFLLGLIVGEGCFSSYIRDRDDRLTPAVRAVFVIGMHNENAPILKYLHDVLSIGNVNVRKPQNNGGEVVEWRVSSFSECKSLRDWILEASEDTMFRYTKKWDSFMKWSEFMDMMESEYHKSPDGVRKMIEVKVSMNRGNAGKSKDELMEEFSHCL